MNHLVDLLPDILTPTLFVSFEICMMPPFYSYHLGYNCTNQKLLEWGHLSTLLQGQIIQRLITCHVSILSHPAAELQRLRVLLRAFLQQMQCFAFVPRSQLQCLAPTTPLSPHIMRLPKD